MSTINNTKNSIFTLFLFLSIFSCFGQGSVRLTKKKLFFDRTSAHKELGVWNVSEKEQEYTVFLRKSTMDKNGKYTIDTINATSLDKHIRFFPRSFKIGPGEIQKVRIQVRDWEALAKNDDYTHVFVKEAISSNDDLNMSPKTKKIGTDVKILIEVGIPLILQKSEAQESNFTINELELVDNNKLKLNLERTGEKSKYCKVKIFHTDSETNKRVNVGILNNVAIFSNMKQRDLLINLNKEVTSGNIEIIIAEDSDSKKAKIYVKENLKV